MSAPSPEPSISMTATAGPGPLNTNPVPCSLPTASSRMTIQCLPTDHKATLVRVSADRYGPSSVDVASRGGVHFRPQGIRDGGEADARGEKGEDGGVVRYVVNSCLLWSKDLGCCDMTCSSPINGDPETWRIEMLYYEQAGAFEEHGDGEDADKG